MDKVTIETTGDGLRKHHKVTVNDPQLRSAMWLAVDDFMIGTVGIVPGDLDIDVEDSVELVVGETIIKVDHNGNLTITQEGE